MPERIIAGRYEVLDMCGKGGTAQVFLVRRRRDQKLFAAKVIHAGMPFTDGQREGALLRRIKDRAVPTLEECFVWEGQCVLIMEWRPGKTLEQRIQEDGGLGLWETLCLGIRLAGLLQKLHGKKPSIFYLDLKPSNILLRPVRGKAAPVSRFEALVDFGCAREADEDGNLRATGMGTEGFAAPEQRLAGQTVTAAADVYGLAATLSYAAASLHRSKRLQAVVERALAPDPKDRYPSMGAFRRALCRCVPDCFLPCFFRKKRLGLLLTVTVVFLLTGAGVRQWTVNRWKQDIMDCFAGEFDADREDQLYRLLEQPPWSGSTAADVLEKDKTFCLELGQRLWRQETGVSARKESCRWLELGAAEEAEKERYRCLENYYRCLEMGQKPEVQETMEALEALSWMVSAREDALLPVTAKELLRCVYALPGEQLQTDQVAAILEKLCRRLADRQLRGKRAQGEPGQGERKETAGELEEIRATAEELLELSRRGRNTFE